MNRWIQHLQKNKGSGKTFRELRAEYRRAHPECCGRKVSKKAITKPNTKTIAKQKTTIDSKTTELTIVTVNVFNGEGRNTKSHLERELNSQNPDVVIVQEAHQSILDGIRNFTVLHIGGPGVHEQMAMMTNNNSEWAYITKTQVASSLCHTKRAAFVYTFKHKRLGKELKIANVHLCGGRFDEASHQRCTKTDDVCASELQNIKEEIVEGVIKHSPSIVAGDFNSDVGNYVTGHIEPAQRQFMLQKGWKVSQINTWNKAAFQKLKSNAFTLVPTETDSFKPTSYFGSTPDAIWFDEKLVKLVNRSNKIFDMGAVRAKRDGKTQYSAASDHDGLMATFKV